MDIDNTLLDFDAAAQEGMEHCFEDAGLTYKPEMFTVFKEENDQIWKKIEQGILTMDDLPYVRWQAILKKLGLEADGVAMEMLFRKCLFYSAVPVEGAKEILDYLQGKYILCIIVIQMLSRSRLEHEFLIHKCFHGSNSFSDSFIEW